VGDLVVGARSGSGEPEKRDAEVPPGTGTPSGSENGMSNGVPTDPSAVDPSAPPYGDPAYGDPSAPAYGDRYGEPPAPPYGDPSAPSYEDPSAHAYGGEPVDLGKDAQPADPTGPAGPDDPDDGDGEGPEGEGGRGKAKQRSFWKELPLLIGIALVLALLIKTFLVQAFSIPSDSMQNTLQEGDRVLVDKLTPWFGSTPSRGEVVVFHDPGGWLGENPPASGNAVTKGLQKGLSFIGLMPSAEEKDLIKRVIGVGGDTVQCKGTGPVIVNGKALDEPYVYPGATPCDPQHEFKVTVPKGRIWVMGDHRDDSLDSRFHMMLPGGGTVSNKEVVGRAIVVAWPINRWDALSIPSTFSQSGINGLAQSTAGAAAPAAAGLAGALPLVLLRRRRRMLKADPERRDTAG
jgi:signal peptidase I